MLDTLAQSWLTLQCRMLPNVRYGLVALDTGGDGTLMPAAYWPQSSRGTSDLLSVARLAIDKRSPVVRGSDSDSDNGPRRAGPERMNMACPLIVDGRPIGVVAVELDAIGENQQRAVLQLLHWGSPWLDLLIRQQTTAVTQRLLTLVQVVSSSIEQRQFRHSAAATVAALARHLECDRVSLGLVDGARVRLASSSDALEQDRRAPVAREIEAVMDEAVDERRTLIHPPPGDAAPARDDGSEEDNAGGSRSVLTVPLAHGDHAIGALSLERAGKRRFDAPTVELCEALAGLLGPILDLKHNHTQPVARRVRDRLSATFAGLLGPRALMLKLVALVLIAATAGAALAPTTLRVSGDAVLEGRVQRAMVAPMRGFIALAPMRAGDLVRAGEVLASLDDRELRLDRRRLESERDELAKEHRRAVARLEGAEAKVLDAQRAQVEARIALIEEQLGRVEIRAPFDGVVVSGDLSQSLGAPVERGDVLFEVAPLDAYRVSVSLEDQDVAAVAPGQPGRLTLAAMPGEVHPIAVERVRGVATAQDGSNVFRVDARIDSQSPYLRPGMIGVAKIEVGQGSVLQAWSRDLFDRVRLWLWASLP